MSKSRFLYPARLEAIYSTERIQPADKSQLLALEVVSSIARLQLCLRAGADVFAKQIGDTPGIHRACKFLQP